MAAKVENIAQSKRRYPKEWLLLTNVTADELTRPIKGKWRVNRRPWTELMPTTKRDYYEILGCRRSS